MLQDLARAQEDYVMTTDMHLTYLITPVDLSAWDRRGPDWSCLYQMLHSLQVSCCCIGCQTANCCFERLKCISKMTAVLGLDCCPACQLPNRARRDEIKCGFGPKGRSVHAHCDEPPEQGIQLLDAYMGCLGVPAPPPPPPKSLHPSPRQFPKP